MFMLGKNYKQRKGQKLNERMGRIVQEGGRADHERRRWFCLLKQRGYNIISQLEQRQEVETRGGLCKNIGFICSSGAE